MPLGAQLSSRRHSACDVHGRSPAAAALAQDPPNMFLLALKRLEIREEEQRLLPLMLIFFCAENSRELALENEGKRIGERIGKRARAAPCCARCTPRAALTRRASHAYAPRPCAQHHSACAGPRRGAAHRPDFETLDGARFRSALRGPGQRGKAAPAPRTARVCWRTPGRVSDTGGLSVGARGAGVREPFLLFCWRTG